MDYFLFEDDREWLTDEKTVLKKINNNTIGKCLKVIALKRGDVVVCCDNEEAIKPFTPNGNKATGIDYKKGWIFAVKDTVTVGNLYAAYTPKGGHVFVEYLRLATEEEKANFKMSKRNV